MSTLATNKNNLRYAEEWVPVKSITNGYITLNNNLKVTGVKVMPRNIFILDQDSQDNVLAALKNFYDTIDFEFWLICADRPVDITIYLSQLQLLYNQTQSPVVRKMIMEDIQKANMFILNNVVDTEYYILFKDKDMDIMNKKVKLLINGLSLCGLNTLQVTNDDLRIVLDNFLNGGTTTEFGTVML